MVARITATRDVFCLATMSGVDLVLFHCIFKTASDFGRNCKFFRIVVDYPLLRNSIPSMALDGQNPQQLELRIVDNEKTLPHYSF